MVEAVVFYSLASILVLSSLIIITRINPIASALMMVVAFIALAGLYGLLSAGFAAVIQILVYAGGILVLIIFVIMILNLGQKELDILKPRLSMLIALLLITGAFFVAPMILTISNTISALPALPTNFGSIGAISALIFGKFVFPFEILSLVLLGAVIGSLVLSRRKL